MARYVETILTPDTEITRPDIPSYSTTHKVSGGMRLDSLNRLIPALKSVES